MIISKSHGEYGDDKEHNIYHDGDERMVMRMVSGRMTIMVMIMSRLMIRKRSTRPAQGVCAGDNYSDDDIEHNNGEDNVGPAQLGGCVQWTMKVKIMIRLMMRIS